MSEAVGGVNSNKGGEGGGGEEADGWSVSVSHLKGGKMYHGIWREISTESEQKQTEQYWEWKTATLLLTIDNISLSSADLKSLTRYM